MYIIQEKNTKPRIDGMIAINLEVSFSYKSGVVDTAVSQS